MKHFGIGMGLVFLMCSCSKPSEQAPKQKEQDGEHHTGEHKEGHEELPKHISVSPKLMADAGIKTAPVRREKLSKVLTLSGEIAADPDKTAKVSAPLAGRIESISFQEGSKVNKGDVLALLRVPELGRVRGALASVQARAGAARAKVNRLKPLVAKNLAPVHELEQAEAEATALESEAKALSMELVSVGSQGNGAMLALRAPLAGVLVQRNAVAGQPVAPDTVIATIVDLSSLWFLGRAFEQDLHKLKLGAPAEVELNAYPGEFFGGTLSFLSSQVDPSARSITARVLLSAPPGKLRLGLFGQARISLLSDTEAQGAPENELKLVVPRSAVIDLAGKPVVFARHSEGKEELFEVHEVTLGEGAQGKVMILSGLREGEDVVVEGAFSLKSLVLKGVFAEEEH